VRADAYPFFDAPFLAFAHRGGARYPPNLSRENTLHAFRQAVALGYRYLETDVHATLDGVLLAFHDPDLDRVSDRTGAIAVRTYAEIRDTRVGGQDPIPTLAELLEAFPAARFNIDAKADATVDLLARTIAEHDAYDRVCVGSFNVARLHRLRRVLGDRIPSAATTAGVALNRFAPGLTPAVNTAGAALQIPESYRVGRRRVRVLTPALVRAAHRAGKHVHVWTVDEATTMDRLLDLGVDGIFADRIDTLKSVLERRGLWT
jgi:glycerophosphoryl diester phosphodiesterase